VRKGSDPFIGREIIGQFVIKKRIGDGGMGAVYLAEQKPIGRDAVIKVLHPQLASAQGMAERFQHEARAASQLNHPHIVIIYNYGAMADGTLFLAMEHLDGPTLAHVLSRGGALPIERAVRIAGEIAQALGEAHRHGVVHRDLKPQNVMLVERGTQREFVKVLDFGIAKVQGVDLTKGSMLAGTPRYMSPEQLRGKAVDGRADLYALGIVLFEMLAGKTPFESDSIVGFAKQHIDETPPTVSSVARRKIPAPLEEIVRRLLLKKPDERFKTARDVAEALSVALLPDRTILTPPPLEVVAMTRPSARAVIALRRSWQWLLGALALLAKASRNVHEAARKRVAKLRARGWMERLGLRRSASERASARIKKTWESMVRRVRRKR
jgi:serine/threonine-protein kinase